jgi:hypothetical protein
LNIRLQQIITLLRPLSNETNIQRPPSPHYKIVQLSASWSHSTILQPRTGLTSQYKTEQALFLSLLSFKPFLIRQFPSIKSFITFSAAFLTQLTACTALPDLLTGKEKRHDACLSSINIRMAYKTQLCISTHVRAFRETCRQVPILI